MPHLRFFMLLLKLRKYGAEKKDSKKGEEEREREREKGKKSESEKKLEPSFLSERH